MLFLFSFVGFLTAAPDNPAPSRPTRSITNVNVPIIRQIHHANPDGSYTFGFQAADGSFRQETRDVKGEVSGKYGFLEHGGRLKTVEYSAGKNGFRPKIEPVELDFGNVLLENRLPSIQPAELPTSVSFGILCSSTSTRSRT